MISLKQSGLFHLKLHYIICKLVVSFETKWVVSIEIFLNKLFHLEKELLTAFAFHSPQVCIALRQICKYGTHFIILK